MASLTARLLMFACGLLLMGASLSASAQGRPPIHVQVVLDSSGSMKISDPARLSALGGMIFADLAGPDDWVGVLAMQNGRFVREPIAKIGERRDAVRRSIETVPFSGRTYCTEPLDEARKGLAKLREGASDARQFVVFLSDGACTDASRGIDSDDVRAAAAGLAKNGVRIFSIGLFGPDDAAADLRTMATVTGGDLFEVERAADLPETFAAILGRIVGSEAVPVKLTAGKDVVAELDGYIYDASFIATGSRAAVVFDKAAGPQTSLALPHKSSSSLQRDDFQVASFGNGQGQHYSVLRISEPEAGAWTFRVDGPADLEGLLIQNYALDPVVAMNGRQAVFALGSDAAPTGWLRGRDGKPITDAKFLVKIDFTAYLTNPAGEERELPLTVSEDGKFRGSAKLDAVGTWSLRGRARMKSGGLNKLAEPTTFEVSATTLAVSADQQPIDLGRVKAGTTTDPYACDLGASELPGSMEVTLRIEGVEEITLGTTSAKLSAGSTKISETFAIGIDHPGGTFAAQLVIEGDGQRVTIPVSGEVIPISFWEKWGRLVMAIVVGVLGLLLLLFIAWGYAKSHSFSRSAVLHYGDSRAKLERNHVVITEQRLALTRRGWHKNATLPVGGPTGFPSGGQKVGLLEATGPSQITLRAGSGVELFRVSKFDDSKTTLVEEGAVRMQSGEVYKIGRLYLRLR